MAASFYAATTAIENSISDAIADGMLPLFFVVGLERICGIPGSSSDVAIKDCITVAWTEACEADGIAPIDSTYIC